MARVPPTTLWRDYVRGCLAPLATRKRGGHWANLVERTLLGFTTYHDCADWQIVRLSQRHIDAYVAMRRESTRSATVRTELAILKSAFRFTLIIEPPASK